VLEYSGEVDDVKEVLLAIRLEPLAEGGYLATSDELPGLVAQGRTIAETLEIAQDVARRLVESYHEHGDPLPTAIGDGQVTAVDIRIPVAMS
jgi:predicted RNase H-like HicB family nuclease